MPSALVHRTVAVLRGDADAIRLLGSDPRATDQTLPVAFFVLMAASLPGGLADPVGWVTRAFVVSGVGLVVYAAALWLIGKAFDGHGRFIALFRLAGFTFVPLVLGLVPVVGLAVGAVWSFALTARVLWALHVEEGQVAVVTAVLPSMLIIALVVALAARTIT